MTENHSYNTDNYAPIVVLCLSGDVVSSSSISASVESPLLGEYSAGPISWETLRRSWVILTGSSKVNDGQKSNIMRHGRKNYLATRTNDVLTVVLGLSGKATTSSSAHQLNLPRFKADDQEIITARRDPLQDLPEWLRDCTEILVDEKSSSSSNETADFPEPCRPVPLPRNGSGSHNEIHALPEEP